MTTFPTHWHGGGRESECGGGSIRKNMAQVMHWLPILVRGLNPAPTNTPSIVELGCGDLNFARSCGLLQFDYTGYDLKARDAWKYQVPPYVKLHEADITQLGPVEADIIIVRDVFIHLPTPMVSSILGNLKYKYLLSTTYVDATNKGRSPHPNAGFQAINLGIAPFNLKADMLIQEHAPTKYLGVYR